MLFVGYFEDLDSQRGIAWRCADNRRRLKGDRGKRLQKKRSELVERSFAHICETGRARRSWLRGLEKVNKRYKIVAAARNLGLVMRKLFGIGKPRCLQGGCLPAYSLHPTRQTLEFTLTIRINHTTHTTVTNFHNSGQANHHQRPNSPTL